MGLNKRYKIIIEDEASLQKKVNFIVSSTIVLVSCFGFLLITVIVGLLIILYTPMKSFLPGYMKESERTATEEQHLRLDSLSKVYEINEAYVTSILNALNPPEVSTSEIYDSIEKKPIPIKLDSLLSISSEERNFMESIRARDKFEIPYNSTAAAQNMTFGSVNPAAIISEDSKNKYQVEILIPSGQPVTTITEGKVISMASSPRYSGTYEIIIQHPKGFLSKTSRLSNLLVKPGDRVSGGQIIALGTAKNGSKNNRVLFELWHDGDPLMPLHYLNGGIQSE